MPKGDIVFRDQVRNMCLFLVLVGKNVTNTLAQKREDFRGWRYLEHTRSLRREESISWRLWKVLIADSLIGMLDMRVRLPFYALLLCAHVSDLLGFRFTCTVWPSIDESTSLPPGQHPLERNRSDELDWVDEGGGNNDSAECRRRLVLVAGL